MNVANRYSVTLDVNKAKYTINSPIGLREGDSGTATIVATILDNGATYSGMTSAQFFAQKPDGTAVATDPATVSGNTITYKVTNNLTTASGHIVNAYFLINKSVSTESFEINIHPSITLHGPSTDYIPGLNDLTRVWQQTINEWQGKFDELKAQLENTDYSQVIKDSLNTALDEAKEAYQAQFNQAVSEVNDTIKALEAKGVEADTEIAKLKTKQDNAETVADSLQATVDQLNKKILDIDKWLDSLHDEFTAKNETYMKSMQAELTRKLADMKASSDSALNVVKGNISTAQTDIDGLDSKITELKGILKEVSDSVADINVPQIKADVDSANANATQALKDVESKAGKQELTQLTTDLVNDQYVDVYASGNPSDTVKIDFVGKKQGDGLPYKAFILNEAINDSTDSSTATKAYTTPEFDKEELSDARYDGITKFTTPHEVNWNGTTGFKPVLVQISPSSFPANITINMPNDKGDHTGRGSTYSGYGKVVITSNSTKKIFVPRKIADFKNITKDGDNYTFKLNDSNSDLLVDGSFWVIVAIKSETNAGIMFGWNGAESKIVYPNNNIQKQLSSNFVKRSELNTSEYIKKTDVDANYIKKTDVATNYVKKSELNTLVDLTKYPTTEDMNKAIALAFVDMPTNTGVNNAIHDALKAYVATADLKQANYNAGFNSDWYGTEAEYNAITTKDAHVNYHTKEEG